MQITNLRTFIAIARAGGFHSAAEQLNITQAAVSARIKALEEHLGQRLFDRGRSGAALTAAGKQFQLHALQIIRSWDHATNMLGIPASQTVPIRIGAQFSTWAQMVMDWGAWIVDSVPEAELQLDFDFNTDMLQRVQEGRLDLAITHAATPAPGLISVPLSGDSMVLVAARAATLGDAQMPPFIDLDWGAQFAGQLGRIRPRLPEARIAIGSGLLGLRYIQEHDACAYVPLRSARALLRQKLLFRIRRAPKFTIAGQIVYSEDNPHRFLLERAVGEFRDMPRETTPTPPASPLPPHAAHRAKESAQRRG